MYQTSPLSAWEAEARRLQLQKQSELQSQTLSPTQNTTVTERHIIHQEKRPVLIEIQTKRPHTCQGEENYSSFWGKSVWRFLKPKQQQKTKTNTNTDNEKKMTQLYHSWVLVKNTQFINCPDTSTSSFMAALFTASKSRSQPRCQTSEERTRKSNIWDLELYSDIRRVEPCNLQENRYN